MSFWVHNDFDYQRKICIKFEQHKYSRHDVKMNLFRNDSAWREVYGDKQENTVKQVISNKIPQLAITQEAVPKSHYQN